jgi:hypothetical protein
LRTLTLLGLRAWPWIRDRWGAYRLASPLSNPDPAVKQRAAESLADLGASAWPALADATRSRDATARAAEFLVRANADPALSVPAFLRLLRAAPAPFVAPGPLASARRPRVTRA